MSRNKYRNGLVLAVLMVSFGALILAGCCSEEKNPPKGNALAPSTRPVMLVASGKGGAQLWSENCMRCHYLRPPTEFSAAEWETIVHHMRLRAGLTGEEQRAIAEFLKSAAH